MDYAEYLADILAMSAPASVLVVLLGEASGAGLAQVRSLAQLSRPASAVPDLVTAVSARPRLARIPAVATGHHGR